MKFNTCLFCLMCVAKMKPIAIFKFFSAKELRRQIIRAHALAASARLQEEDLADAGTNISKGASSRSRIKHVTYTTKSGSERRSTKYKVRFSDDTAWDLQTLDGLYVEDRCEPQPRDPDGLGSVRNNGRNSFPLPSVSGFSVASMPHGSQRTLQEIADKRQAVELAREHDTSHKILSVIRQPEKIDTPVSSEAPRAAGSNKRRTSLVDIIVSDVPGINRVVERNQEILGSFTASEEGLSDASTDII